jgi:hypothetical protein
MKMLSKTPSKSLNLLYISFTLCLLINYSLCAKSYTYSRGDFVAAGADTQAGASAQEGNAGSLSTAGATSGQIVVNSPNGERQVQYDKGANYTGETEGQEDNVVSLSTSLSGAKTDDGHSLSAAVADSTAYREEQNVREGSNVQNNIAAASLAGSAAQSGTGNSASISASKAAASDLKFDEKGNLVKTLLKTYIPSVWFDTRHKALDIDVGSQGDIFTAGIDKKVYYYDHIRNAFSEVDANGFNPNLQGAVRISVGYDGTPYVVTITGETFYLSCDNKWIRLPGCASDISFGRGGEIYKTGCEPKGHGFPVFRLFCTCKSECCTNNCRRFRTNPSYEDGAEKKKCHWFRFEGSGLRIATAPNGWPIVTKSDNSIAMYDGADWRTLGDMQAMDIAVSNEGVLYCVGIDKNLYKLTDEKRGTYERIMSITDVMNVGVGPFGLPAVTRCDDHVFTSTKTIFN